MERDKDSLSCSSWQTWQQIQLSSSVVPNRNWMKQVVSMFLESWLSEVPERRKDPHPPHKVSTLWSASCKEQPWSTIMNQNPAWCDRRLRWSWTIHSPALGFSRALENSSYISSALPERERCMWEGRGRFTDWKATNSGMLTQYIFKDIAETRSSPQILLKTSNTETSNWS